jgi:hypothetical protein
MTENEKIKRDHFFGNKTYDFVKFSAQILLPAVGTLYFALAGIWNLPSAEEVIGSITAFDAFLGALLGVSSISYNKSDAKYAGTIEVSKTDEKKTFLLDLNSDPDDLDKQQEVLFKIQPVKEGNNHG